MRYFERVTLFLLLLFTVWGYSDRSAFTKTVTLKKGQSVVLRINGTNSLRSFWSVQKVLLSSRLKEYSYSVDSPDSSFVRYITSFFNGYVSKRYLNSVLFYDSIRDGEVTSTIYLSPYGRSFITLTNDYKDVDNTMSINVRFSQEFSFLYPFFTVVAVLLYRYAVKLYSNDIFLYAISLVLSPILVLVVLCYSITTLVVRSRTLQLIIKLSFIFLLSRFMLCHSFYRYLQLIIIRHPLFSLVYSSICFGITLYYMTSHIRSKNTANIRTIFASLKLIPLFLLFSCSSSVQISLTLFLAIVILGFVSGQLKMKNITNEWRLIYACLTSDFLTQREDFFLSLEQNEYTYKSIYQEISEMKQYLKLHNMEMRLSLSGKASSYINEFMNSSRLIMPEYSMYVVMKNAIRDNERMKSQSHYGGPMDTTTMIVDDAPVYSYNTTPVEDGFWNRLQKGLKYIFQDSSQSIPSSSFSNQSNTVGTTNPYTYNNRYGTTGSTNLYSFNNHNNTIGTTDTNPYRYNYYTPHTSSIQRPYGMNTRPMDIHTQPTNDILQTPSKPYTANGGYGSYTNPRMPSQNFSLPRRS